MSSSSPDPSKERRRAPTRHIMATLGAEGVLESEGWDQHELSEMKSLLQRAEQRMTELNPASKHMMKATNLCKYVTAAYRPMLRT